MLAPFNSAALRKAYTGGGGVGDIQTDALGRAAFRANQDRANSHLVGPSPDVTGLPPALAGAIGGGMPNYQDPLMRAQHGQHTRKGM